MTRSIVYTLFGGVLCAALALTLTNSTELAAAEYKSKAQKTKLLKDPLGAFDNMEANVLRFDLPPGYVGGKHYHTGDVFVYVQKGSFTVNSAGKTTTFKAGEVYHETPNVPMIARNLSSTEGVTFIVFQVGKTGEPIMMKAK